MPPDNNNNGATIHRFELVPFQVEPSLASVRLHGRVGLERGPQRLSIQFRLEDPDEQVLLAAPAEPPERRDGLWTTTCFEWFLAEAGAESYREFNLAPSGHWNVYRLSGYRRELREDPAFARLPFELERRAAGLELRAVVELGGLVEPGAALELAVTAVVEAKGGAISYWALNHPGDEADFHRRDGFSLRF
jgi:hypothetical protein